MLICTTFVIKSTFSKPPIALCSIFTYFLIDYYHNDYYLIFVLTLIFSRIISIFIDCLWFIFRFHVCMIMRFCAIFDSCRLFVDIFEEILDWEVIICRVCFVFVKISYKIEAFLYTYYLLNFIFLLTTFEMTFYENIVYLDPLDWSPYSTSIPSYPIFLSIFHCLFNFP